MVIVSAATAALPINKVKNRRPVIRLPRMHWSFQSPARGFLSRALKEGLTFLPCHQ